MLAWCGPAVHNQVISCKMMIRTCAKANQWRVTETARDEMIDPARVKGCDEHLLAWYWMGQESGDQLYGTLN
jgi:hypothetical protein